MHPFTGRGKFRRPVPQGLRVIILLIIIIFGYGALFLIATVALTWLVPSRNEVVSAPKLRLAAVITGAGVVLSLTVVGIVYLGPIVIMMALGQ